MKQAGRDFELVDAGYRAIDSLSCEKGYRHWHADLRPDDTPLEAGLGFACKLKSRTDFLGREALELQKQSGGLQKRLVTLTIDAGDHAPAHGHTDAHTAASEAPKALWGLEAIKRDGVYVGYLRRVEYGFTLGSNIGYGYVSVPGGGVVDRDFLRTGSWEIEAQGVTLPATLHLKHPFDPKHLRLKGFYDQLNECKVSQMYN